MSIEIATADYRVLAALRWRMRWIPSSGTQPEITKSEEARTAWPNDKAWKES